MLLKEQISAARAILKITQRQLADLAKLSPLTITNIEKSDKSLESASFATISKIKNALEDKGIEFIEPDNPRQNINGFGVKYYPIKEE